MPRLKLIRAGDARAVWEVERITGKKFTPDRSYPGTLSGGHMVSQENYFTLSDVRRLRNAHLPFRVRLVDKNKV